MNAIALLLWVSAFSSFGWGMLRFFQKPSGLTWRAGLVAVLGLTCGAWHCAAIATAGIDPWSLSVGIALFALSITLFWWAIRACRSQPLTAIFESDPPLRLVRGGPYRHLRHPFYASYTLFWVAGWIVSASLLSLGSAAIMLAIYLNAAQREECKFMSSTLADEYAEYRRSTGLMIPRPPLRYLKMLLPRRRVGARS